MGTADQDFRIAPPISAALRQRVEHENYGYMAIPESYYESIIDWNKRRYGLEISRDSIRNSDGVHTGIISTLRAFCPPGSKVLMNTPTYDGFYSDIRIVGLVAEESPMKVVDGKYKIDFADLERRIDHETHAFILCNPHNPTGNLWSREDLMTLGEICTKRRVVVLADEIHCDFVAAGNTYTPYATLDDEAIVRNSITYKSVSKSFNLSSLKCAYLFSTNPDYLTRITGAGQHRQSMNTLGIVAAEAAYNHCEDWLDQVITYIDGTTDYVEQFVGSRLPGRELCQAGGNLPELAGHETGHRPNRCQGNSHRGRCRHHPRKGAATVPGRPCEYPHQPGVKLRARWQWAHADEPRDVALPRRAGAPQSCKRAGLKSGAQAVTPGVARNRAHGGVRVTIHHRFMFSEEGK